MIRTSIQHGKHTTDVLQTSNKKPGTNPGFLKPATDGGYSFRFCTMTSIPMLAPDTEMKIPATKMKIGTSNSIGMLLSPQDKSCPLLQATYTLLLRTAYPIAEHCASPVNQAAARVEPKTS